MEEFKNLFSQNKSDALYIDKKEIKQRIKPTKKEFYKKERQDILDKINNIIGITKDNNIFYLYDIENNMDKKKEIFDLAHDIKKYFKTGSWAVFNREISKDNHVLLIKSVFKDMEYQVIGKAYDVTRDGNKIRTTKYIIMQNEK